MCSIKNWMNHPDFVLARLSTDFINRHLFRIKIRKNPFTEQEIERVKDRVSKGLGLKDLSHVDYFVLFDSISNSAYSSDDEHINILYHNGEIRDISEASDMFDLSLLDRTVTRYYLCYPKCLGELLD